VSKSGPLYPADRTSRALADTSQLAKLTLSNSEIDAAGIIWSTTKTRETIPL